MALRPAHIKKGTSLKEFEKKTEMLRIRISPHLYNWIKKKGYSPVKIFYEAVLQLRYKPKKKKVATKKRKI